jgi:Immunity protein 10
MAHSHSIRTLDRLEKLTILSFVATEVGVDDDDVLVAGLGRENPFQYATFQRNVESSDDDWGVHFEFNNQINGKYQCIASCSVSRNRLTVELTEPIDWQKQISVVDIQFDITDTEYESFIAILRRIFREYEFLLHIMDDRSE